MTAAMAHERRLYLTAHPFVYPLLRALARRGPVVRLPGIGAVVNDAALAREVLMNGESFRKDGPGSAGELWTSVLGPSVLLNMEGGAHRTMRRKLAELFTPTYTTRLCETVLAEPLARLDAQLASGEKVDLVEATRTMAGAVICELIGIDIQGTPAERENTFRHYYQQGSEVIAMVKMTTRKFSATQLTKAHAVLDPIADIAAESWADGDESTVVGRMRVLGLSEEEARGATGAFFITGTETVATAVPRLIALLHDSGRLQALADSVRAGEPGSLDTAIEEALRVTTPTPMMVRSVARATRIGPVAVRPGDRILIATHNCARAYGDFDPDRPHPPEIRRLWFGAGPHFCIGYPLAMAEMRALTRTVLNRAPLRITDRRAARGVLLPAYDRLEVVSG
jgi:cytochrome P450